MLDGKQPLPSDAEDGALEPQEADRTSPQEDDKRVEEDPSEQPS